MLKVPLLLIHLPDIEVISFLSILLSYLKFIMMAY